VISYTLLLLALLIPAQLNMPCGDRDEMVSRLSTVYGEHRVGMGLSGPQIMFELFRNPVSRTWTILRTAPNGTSCFVVSGFSWEVFPDGIEI